MGFRRSLLLLLCLVGAVGLVRYLGGWQTDQELWGVFLLGLAREFVLGASVQVWERLVTRGGAAAHPDWSLAKEAVNAGARRASAHLNAFTDLDESHFFLMRDSFELLGYLSVQAMEDARLTIFDYDADGVRCRAVVPNRLLPRAKRALGLPVSAEDAAAALEAASNDPVVVADDRLRWVLHHHGGGYVSGTLFASQSAGLHYAVHAKHRLELVVVMPEYALAPELRFPNAVLDGITAFEWHARLPDVSPSDIVLAGESAGGGLVAAMLLALRDGLDSHLDDMLGRSPLAQKAGEAHRPAGAVLMSPMLDVRHDAEYCEDRANLDVITSSVVRSTSRAYVPDASVAATNVLASPMLADLHDMGPLLLTAGGAEIFHPSVEEFASKAAEAAKADAPVQFLSFGGETHSFQLEWGDACEACRDVYDAIIDFTELHTNNQT